MNSLSPLRMSRSLTMHRRLLAFALALLPVAPVAVMAATHVVGPPGAGLRLVDVLRQAQDGDTIEVLPGTYTDETAVVLQRRLTLRGLGERPVFVAPSRLAEQKAILVLRDGDITIENLEFRGARVPDLNGAGIRFENGRLTVRRCRFSDNENGILTGNEAGASLRIEDSEFDAAPRHREALFHLLYVGRIGELDVRGSHFHGGYNGHLVKSRARRTTLRYNLIADGTGGQASYEIDLPNGGLATLIGNVVQQGVDTRNAVLVSFGAEGNAWPQSALHLAHNTLISEGPGRLLQVWPERLPAGVAVNVLNNLGLGPALLSLGNPGHFAGNYPALSAMLEDPARLHFALRAGSLLQGRGVEPRLPDGTVLAPSAEFSPPVGTRAIAAPVAWTPGAFQR